LFIACKSLKEFKLVSKGLKKNITPVYWPIFDNKDGYWVSSFTRRRALVNLFSELKSSKVPVMLDMELPFTRNKFLFLSELLNCFRNNKLINDFLKNYKGKVYTAEYLFEPFFLNFMYKDPKVYGNKVIKMVYSSMVNLGEFILTHELKHDYEKEKGDFLVGLGTIAIGVLGDEPILSSKLLERDLRLCKEIGIKEVVIFRLGGLNKEYLKVIKKVL